VFEFLVRTLCVQIRLGSVGVVDRRLEGIMDEQFVNFVRRKLREMGMGYGQFADQVGISRSGLYKILGGNGSGMLVSTLLSMSHALKVHPSSMLRMLAPDRRLARQEESPSFIGDVALPDYSPVLPGEKFTKTWMSQNNTDSAWHDCSLTCIDSNLRVVRELPDGSSESIAVGLRPTKRSIHVPETAPKQKVELSVEFTAPQTPGTVMSMWKMVGSDDREVFPDRNGLTCVVRVVSL